MRILFMGTPEFALVSLKRLHEAGEDICGVVTQADKPAGRGYKLKPPPVKTYALEHGIAVYQPDSLKAEFFADTLAELAPELIAVVAYGKMLPVYVLNYPKYGCINVHGSLLPRHRGASPIQQAIICGDEVTGVTVQYMDVAMDTGDMLVKAETPVYPDDNAGTLHDRLALIGADSLLAAIEQIKQGIAVRVPQCHEMATYCGKISSEACRIDWNRPGKDIFNLVRGLSPFPGAYTTLNSKVLKIYECRFRSCSVDSTPGSAVGELEITCADGVIVITELQLDGTKRMSAEDYLRGRKLPVGTVLGN